MLTSELLRVRRRGTKLHPAFLRDVAFDELVPLAELLIGTFTQCEGTTVDELHEALAEFTRDERDRVRVAGLVKLLEDSCEVDGSSGTDAERVRSGVFRTAARVRGGLSLCDVFDRSAVLAEAAVELEVPAAQVDRLLFCDLPGAQIVAKFPLTTPTALLHRYNLALAQGVLLRASRVIVDLLPTTATRYRELFRALRFRRLMADVSGSATEGYRIVIDGPMSLFEATQRYGLQLAMFLPVLVGGEGWTLTADIAWGKAKDKAVLELSDRDGLVSHYRGGAGELDEVAALEASFARLGGPWTVHRDAGIFELKGKGTFMPDLVFRHGTTGAAVHLEAFGYWSRDAVFKRVELLEQGFEQKFILAVSRRLRVSPEIAAEDFPGKILVYTGSIPAHAVRRMLDEIAGA